jgi:hypothetical protein
MLKSRAGCFEIPCSSEDPRAFHVVKILTATPVRPRRAEMTVKATVLVAVMLFCVPFTLMSDPNWSRLDIKWLGTPVAQGGSK